MKIGMLTSGGDSPGLNAVIRGAVLKGVLSHDAELVGFRHGWRGLVEEDFITLDRHAVRGLSKQGGTILGTSRTNPFEGENGGPERIQAITAEQVLAAAQQVLARERSVTGLLLPKPGAADGESRQ